MDLSASTDSSVNDGIDSGLCYLEYATVDQVGSLARQAGRVALMSKLDVSSTYRRVPVHPHDQHLLGIKWQGVVYCDKALPFGLWSAPKLFTAVADGLAWATLSRGIPVLLHYLDNFFFRSPPDSAATAVALRIAVPLCIELGLPTVPSKVEGPATCINFLGIEIDSVSQELRLLVPKLTQLVCTLYLWAKWLSATKRDQLQRGL